MTQFNDLHDDCLMEVLDRLSPDHLFKMQLINKRMNRLVVTKMRVKIKAIKFWENDMLSKCSHFNSVSSDQILVLESVFGKQIQDYQPSLCFLSLLNKCSGVKSIDFTINCPELPVGLILEVAQRCPELECIKLGLSFLEDDEWDLVLDRIGHQIIHFAKTCYDNVLSDARLLETVAEKCSNIKQVDWLINGGSNISLMSAIKMLPKNCWITLKCFRITEDTFEDVVDELDARTLDWPAISHRLDRLSSLKFRFFDRPFNGPVIGVDFVGLKKLDTKIEPNNAWFVNYLIASRFPLLEEFGFNACGRLTQDEYSALFQRIASIKKLTIYCDQHVYKNISRQLPRSVAFQQLKKLETIDVDINNVPKNWKVDNFIRHVERCTIGIATMKKLTVVYCLGKRFQWTSIAKQENRKLNRVEVVYRV